MPPAKLALSRGCWRCASPSADFLNRLDRELLKMDLKAVGANPDAARKSADICGRFP